MTNNINLWSIKKSYFWFLRLFGVTIATSSSGSARDFLKLSFHTFPYNEIFKVSKVTSNLIFETSTSIFVQKHGKLRESVKYVTLMSMKMYSSESFSLELLRESLKIPWKSQGTEFLYPLLLPNSFF